MIFLASCTIYNYILFLDVETEDMDIAVTDAASEILGKGRCSKKSHGLPKMFSTSVMRGEI